MDARHVAEWVILGAAVITALGVLWAKVLGPFIGKPIGKAIRTELEDLVEQIVVRLNNELLRRIGSHESRLNAHDNRLEKHDNRLDILETDMSSLLVRFRSHFALHKHEEEE